MRAGSPSEFVLHGGIIESEFTGAGTRTQPYGIGRCDVPERCRRRGAAGSRAIDVPPIASDVRPSQAFTNLESVADMRPDRRPAVASGIHQQGWRSVAGLQRPVIHCCSFGPKLPWRPGRLTVMPGGAGGTGFAAYTWRAGGETQWTKSNKATERNRRDLWTLWNFFRPTIEK